MLHAVVMAGGSGTRFWPESRAALPKQMLRLVGERSMIQATIERLGELVPRDRVMIVTSALLADVIRAQIPDLPREAVIGEPCKRDTAPCIGLAAVTLLARDPDATMVVLPSDHVIGPEDAFRDALAAAARLVEESPGRIVTFGVRPTYPAESYGYIERGEPLAPSSAEGMRVFRVRRFREKPKAEVAREFLAAGTFYWNSGIFVWKAATILEEIAKREPDMRAHLTNIARSIGRADHAEVFEREFAAITPRSIDYAVMEHAQDVAVIEANFEWDDVGSWQSMARIRGSDASGNTLAGRHLAIDTIGSIVRTDDDHLVVTLGVEDLIVIRTPSATLVASKHREEDIRRVVKLLEERGWQDLL